MTVADRLARTYPAEVDGLELEVPVAVLADPDLARHGLLAPAMLDDLRLRPVAVDDEALHLGAGDLGVRRAARVAAEVAELLVEPAPSFGRPVSLGPELPVNDGPVRRVGEVPVAAAAPATPQPVRR